MCRTTAFIKYQCSLPQFAQEWQGLLYIITNQYLCYVSNELNNNVIAPACAKGRINSAKGNLQQLNLLVKQEIHTFLNPGRYI